MIWFAPYELVAKRRLSAVARDVRRRGALIRVGDGFADVHPWPELGDAPLDEQLALLARRETTPLTRASLRFAALDGAARAEGRWLFDGVAIPESHWPGAEPPPAFDTVKLKCGRDFEAASLPDGVRLRLDFNGTLEPEAFVRIAATLPRERIDFVEDPCPYDDDVWRALRERTGIRLALDRGNGEEADVLVVKPAVQEVPRSGRELVVTSYMDHALGQLAAAYVAAGAATTSDRCGLATHVLYEEDAFLERMGLDGARLVPPRGTGFGFDDLLEALPWRALA